MPNGWDWVLASPGYNTTTTNQMSKRMLITSLLLAHQPVQTDTGKLCPCGNMHCKIWADARNLGLLDEYGLADFSA